MQYELMGGKSTRVMFLNTCTAFEFCNGYRRNMEREANFVHKTKGWGNVSRKIKGIFSSWVRFLQAVRHEVSTCKNQNRLNVLSHNNTDGIAI